MKTSGNKSAIKDADIIKRLPAWLRRNSDDASIEAIPERAEIIRQIFTFSKDGLSAKEIANRLTQDRITAWGTTGEWTPVYVMKILTSKTVLGFASRSSLIKAKSAVIYPPVISDELWTAAQSARQTNPPGRKTESTVENLFPGLYFNSERKCKMRVFQKGKRARYIVDCTQPANPKQQKKYLDYIWFENTALQCLANYKPQNRQSPESNLKNFNGTVEQIQDLIRQRTEFSRLELRRLIRLIVLRIEIFPNGRVNLKSSPDYKDRPVCRMVYRNGDTEYFA